MVSKKTIGLRGTPALKHTHIIPIRVECFAYPSAMLAILRKDHALFACGKGSSAFKCAESLKLSLATTFALQRVYIYILLAHCWPRPLRISASLPPSLQQLLLHLSRHRRHTPRSSWNARLFPSVSGREPWHQPVLGGHTSG